MNTRAQKIARLRNKAYRDAFVASQISVGLPFQIRCLREQRDWTQSKLAKKAGMLQPRVSAMERPGGTKFTLETLRRLASALDVALLVRFAPFSELVDWSEDFNPDTFHVPNFEQDIGLIERKEPHTASTTATLRIAADPTETGTNGSYHEATPTANDVIMFPMEQAHTALAYAQGE